MSLAEQDADLGLPVPSGARFRLLRQLIAKATWPMLRHQTILNHSVIRALDDLRTRLDSAEHFVRVHIDSLEHHTEVLARFEATLARHEAALERDEIEATVAVHARALEQQMEVLVRFEGTLIKHASLLDDLSPLVDNLSSLVDELPSFKCDVQQTLERVEKVGLYRFQEETSSVRRDLAEVLTEVDRQADNSEVLKRALAEQQMRFAQLDLFFADYRRSLDGHQLEPSPHIAATLPLVVEGIYGALEDAFRGSPALIKDRLKVYLDEVTLATAGGGEVLDLGSGRGEWLELLSEQGIKAHGVDSNVTYNERWEAAQIKVATADVLDHLRSLAPRSMAVVTAFHLVEHLSLEVLIELIDLANRVLQPGGLLIMETPNPENIVVGASTFYLDPTHQRPIPPALLEFLTGARGFLDVKIKRLERGASPELPIPRNSDGSIVEDLGPLVEIINARFFGPEDYAVLARRA
ncbi:MAG TPA: methyltransferase domain-containing protein [Acidimicrobiales bacterium]|nr:methyltransferase domain-containing protein [Acidimicrobiales bacterium]